MNSVTVNKTNPANNEKTNNTASEHAVKSAQTYVKDVTQTHLPANQKQLLENSREYAKCSQNAEEMSKAGVAYSEFAGKSNKSADNGEQTESTKQSTISEFRQKPGIFSNCSGANQKNYTDKITGEDQKNIHESESPVSLDSDMKVKSSIAIKVPFRKALQLNNCPYKKEGMCLPIAKLGIKYCLNEGGLAFIKGLTHLKEATSNNKEIMYDDNQALVFLNELVVSGLFYDLSANEIKALGIDATRKADMDAIKKALKGSIIVDADYPKWKGKGNKVESNGLNIKERITAHFSFDEIKDFLQKIKDENGNKPWSVLVMYSKNAVSIGFDGTKWLASNHNDHIYTDHLSDAVDKIMHYKQLKNSRLQARLEIVENENSGVVVNKQAKKDIAKLKCIGPKTLFNWYLLSTYRFLVTVRIFVNKISNMPIMKPVNSIISLFESLVQKTIKLIINIFRPDKKEKTIDRVNDNTNLP